LLETILNNPSRAERVVIRNNVVRTEYGGNVAHHGSAIAPPSAKQKFSLRFLFFFVCPPIFFKNGKEISVLLVFSTAQRVEPFVCVQDEGFLVYT